MNVYFISGLGADKRAFQYLQIDDRLKVHHLDWLKAHPKETLKAYSKRMAQCIDSTEPFCLVGLSFGGIVAQEIAKILPPQKLVLISTVKFRSELPLYFKLAGIFNLHYLLPANFLFSNRVMIHRFFGAKSNKEKQLLNEILDESDPQFIKWAIDKIVKWKNTAVPKSFLHLHGTSDVIFPIRNIVNCTVISEGTHLMVLKKFRSVSNAINTYLLDSKKAS